MVASFVGKQIILSSRESKIRRILRNYRLKMWRRQWKTNVFLIVSISDKMRHNFNGMLIMSRTITILNDTTRNLLIKFQCHFEVLRGFGVNIEALI